MPADESLNLMDIKRLSRIDLAKFAGKVCLLSVDFNIEPEQKESSLRVVAVLPTLRALLRAKVKIVLISHRGRPEPLAADVLCSPETIKSSVGREFSLRPFREVLAREIKRPVNFIGHFDFSRLKEEIDDAKEPIVILENTRFLTGETENSAKLVKELARLADFYVDDAFANAHRKHVSTFGLAKAIPAYAGLLMEREVDRLSQAVFRHQKPFALILGGAKVKDKASVIKYWISRADFILLGGGLANTFLAKKGVDIGKSVYDADTDVSPFMKSRKIILPSDWTGEGGKILDIGPATIEAYSAIIKGSKTVVWSGPIGLIENKKYAAGTTAVACAIAKIKRRAFTLAGGGETTGFIRALGLEKKFDLVSTGGGAMLEFLSGKNLPGVQVLMTL